MRFVKRAVAVSRALVSVVGFGLVVSLSACADGLAPLSLAPAPDSLSVVAVRPGVVRLTWAQVKGVEVTQYIVERRVNFEGSFVEVARVTESNLGQLSWLDTDIQPATVYGYRVFSLTLLGEKSRPSVTGGTLTPPRPGIDISTNSSATLAEAQDPDGYTLTIIGPDTVRAAIGVAATRRFAPLKTGRYAVSLGGVIDRCSVTGPATRELFVTDTSAATITPVVFNVVCRDPNRGDISVNLAVSGANPDNAFSLDVLGQSADTTLPPAERVYSAKRNINGEGNPNEFLNLRPGSYTVTLRDVAANCALQGAASRTVAVTKLAVATVSYVIACTGPGGAPPTSTKPFIWRNRWLPKTAASGSTVELEHTLDLTARAGQGVRVVQSVFRYDASVLRFEEETAGQLPQLTINASTPGTIRYVATTTSAARTGVVSLARFRFTITGATGRTSPTVTTVQVASSPVEFVDSVRVVEDTLTVGAGAPSVNQPPVSRAGGPYNGTAGTALTLSGAGSTDADGTIASYAWNFGDNTNGIGIAPSKTYSSAGTYTANLTVTDDKGATATSQATVTISAAPGGATPPVARANGPYTATVGSSVTLSSAGSTNATSFSWLLGNGQTASGASPSVTYGASGTFTITLTASGAGGLTSTSSTTVTVTAVTPPTPPPTPPPAPSPTMLEWNNLFGPYDVTNREVAITIRYDTRVNLTETPGPEALEKFAVDSLKWNPAVLQFVSINLGPNIIGNSNQVGASSGRLGLSGTIGGVQQQGLIVIATIRFRPVGTTGQTTTTRTFLGALIGPSSTGFYSYNSKTTIIEGDFTVP